MRTCVHVIIIHPIQKCANCLYSFLQSIIIIIIIIYSDPSVYSDASDPSVYSDASDPSVYSDPSDPSDPSV